MYEIVFQRGKNENYKYYQFNEQKSNFIHNHDFEDKYILEDIEGLED